MTGEKQAQPMNDAQLESVAGFFSLGKIENQVRIGEGLANHNFLVTTAKGEFIARQLVIETPEQVENDRAIAKQLAGTGLKAPEYLVTESGSAIFQENGINVVVYPKLIGVTPPEFSDGFCANMGEVLARFHSAVKTLPAQHAGWLNPKIAAAYLADDGFPEPIFAPAKRLIMAGEKLFKLGLPSGIIHGDFHENNVLVDPVDPEKVVAVLDFEEAEPNLLLPDVARLIISLCRANQDREIDRGLMASVIQGYERVRRLEPAERENLDLALGFVAGTGALWLWQHGYEEYAEQYLSRAGL